MARGSRMGVKLCPKANSPLPHHKSEDKCTEAAALRAWAMVARARIRSFSTATTTHGVEFQTKPLYIEETLWFRALPCAAKMGIRWESGAAPQR